MMEQGTQEWRQARCGMVTASRVADIIAKTKTGVSASRANYLAELICERLTGIPNEGFKSPAMDWGVQNEPLARSAYEARTGLMVMETGFVPHPVIEGAGASPDGLVGTDGLVEIKCPNTATHVETLLEPGVPGKYVTQVQWQMACTGRQWCDFVSFDPRLPEEMQLKVIRVERDRHTIGSLESDVKAFLIELGMKINALRGLYVKGM